MVDIGQTFDLGLKLNDYGLLTFLMLSYVRIWLMVIQKLIFVFH